MRMDIKCNLLRIFLLTKVVIIFLQKAITDYEVYLEAASYDFSAVVSAKSSPATFEGLKAGSKYYSHIVAFSDGGESRLATSNTTTIFTLTEQPSNLTIVHIDEISMMLEWLPVFGLFSYFFIILII